MAKVCCVCNEVKEASENRLFRCGGQGCGITVHQACYGIVTIPTGLWFCRKCESQERAARVKCELCPKKDGALKRTDSTGSGGWAHVVCALYIPEVTFGNLRTMEPIITSKLPRERFAKVCYICEKVGLETQATVGACMSCHKSNCRMAFHVTCAQKERLLVEEEDPRDPRNIIYCGYCANHYKKMIRQKMKQSLRKHTPGAPPVSGAPSQSGGSSVPPVSTVATLANHSMDLDPARDRGEHSLTPVVHLHKTPLNKHPGSKSKDNDRPLKRPPSESLLPPVKRKYRRRKLSSSNESSTSEAPSNASEILARDPIQPASPMGLFSSDSSISRRDETHQPNTLDNLDLLASVTQKIDTHHPGSRGSLPVSPNSVSSEGIQVLKQLSAEPERETERGRRRKGSSAQSAASGPPATSAAASNVPPKSLQELLEKQWEQTAQFIIDQAGRRNNAGVMLAHLHELQSENRKMKARIMELASQREFFIATNAHLQQSLSESSINKAINGIQLMSDAGTHSNSLSSRGTWVEQPPAGQPTSNAMEIDSSRSSTTNHHHGGGASSQDAPLSSFNKDHSLSSLSHSSKNSLSTTDGQSWSVHPPSGVNAVTHVTNTVQGPISTFPPFPSIPGLTNTSSHSRIPD